MSARVTSSRTLWGVIAALALYGAGVRAAEPPAAPPEHSREMRAKMASAHERMAACLRSDKPMAECRGEMMKSCHEIMGERGCPMMDMHDKSMKDTDSGAPKGK